MNDAVKTTLSIPFPYSVVEFDKNAKALSSPSIPEGTTDLLVISHGWNNSRVEAEQLYSKLLANFADVTKGDPLFAERKLAVIGIIWPAKKFDSDFMQKASIQAGGAAAAGDDSDASQASMHAAVERLAALYVDRGDKVEELRKLLPHIEDNQNAQEDFVETLRELLGRDDTEHAIPAPDDAGQTIAAEDSADVFFHASPANVFQNVSDADVVNTQDPDQIGAVEDGHAAGLGSLLSKAAKAVNDLVNLTSYFEMKKRAGTIGALGLAPLLDQLAGKVVRIHLVGHSFGGRLVTAAAAKSTTNKLHSMSLLQAAFSHNGFSRTMNGFFRSVIDGQRITGPILITHTKNDKAVGVAYPIASRLGRQISDTLGDREDKYGGLGSNGAMKMEQDEVNLGMAKLLPSQSQYAWKAGKLHNLESSEFIRDPENGDAHGWVFVPEVAWAISRAIVA